MGNRDSPSRRPLIIYTVSENQPPRIFQQHHAPAEGEGEGVCAGEEGAQEGVHGEQGARLLRRPPRPRSPLPLHRRLRLPQLQTQNVREWWEAWPRRIEKESTKKLFVTYSFRSRIYRWLPEYHCNRIRNLKLG